MLKGSGGKGGVIYAIWCTFGWQAFGNVVRAVCCSTKAILEVLCQVAVKWFIDKRMSIKKFR